MDRRTLWQAIEGTAVLVCWLQAVRVLFSALFGVIYDAVFVGEITANTIAAGVLLPLAFLTPLLTLWRGMGRERRYLAAGLVFLARFPLTINHPGVRLYSSLVIVAATGWYMALLLQDEPRRALRLLIVALVADQVLRALGYTYDITLRPWWMAPQAVLSAALVMGAYLLRSPQEPAPAAKETTIGISGGLALGAFLFMEISLLALPNAVARWSGAEYGYVVPLLLATTLLPLLVNLDRIVPADPRRGFSFGGALLLFLVLTGLTTGIRADAWLAPLALLAAHLALLVGLPCIASGGGEASPARKSGAKQQTKGGHVPPHRPARRLALALTLGNILFLVLNFAYAFAFTYAYTLYFFRGMGLTIMMTAGLIAMLPALRGLSAPLPPITASSRQLRRGMGIALLLVVLVGWWARPRPLEPARAEDTIRIGTYNIHYGYNTTWRYSLEEIARTIADSGADVVMLQEVDAGRLTSYGVDDALWLGRRLSMKAIYLPCVEKLTGIALLTRLPVEARQGHLLPSEEEQTGLVYAQIALPGSALHAYGVWLGLSSAERAHQLDAALEIMGDTRPAVFAGDLNSTPDSPVHQRLEAAGFIDPFPALGLGPAYTSPAIAPTKRIDYVWLRGLEPIAAQVLDSLASDHRMVVVEARGP